MDCLNTIDLQYNDWVCSGPLKSIMNKKLNIKMVLYNTENYRYQQVLHQKLTDLCSLEQSMFLYVSNYQSIKPTLGTSSATLCPMVVSVTFETQPLQHPILILLIFLKEQLPLTSILFDRAVFPENLPNGQYRINIQVMDENMAEFFNINMYFSLYTKQRFMMTTTPNLLNILLGTTPPPIPDNAKYSNNPRYPNNQGYPNSPRNPNNQGYPNSPRNPNNQGYPNSPRNPNNQGYPNNQVYPNNQGYPRNQGNSRIPVNGYDYDDENSSHGHRHRHRHP
jgi:hypothetical protein